MIPIVVDASWLSEHPEAVIADVRWYMDGSDTHAAYRAGHLPGAVYVNLDRYLAATPSPALGRHPLPDPAVFAEGMKAAGIGDGTIVVAYDDTGGTTAGRLVWLLRSIGEDAALLDGGLNAWQGPVDTDEVVPTPAATFTPRPWPASGIATIDEAACGDYIVLDARAPERYRGEIEPIDARPGHIPGALNAWFGANQNDDQTYRTPEELRAHYATLGVTDAAGVIVYCGSGITGCHDVIALEYAGLGQPRIYSGSWSQYAATDRPAATGPEPGERPRAGVR